MPLYDESRWVLNPDGSRSRRLGVVEVEADDDDDDVSVTKAAQDKADELGVDLAGVVGTGKDGRITVGDVEAAAE